MSDILNKAKSIQAYMISIHRWLHQNPELSGQEFAAQAKIMPELDQLHIPDKKAGNTSLIATLLGAQSGKTIALRAETDAVPIQEESGVEFASNNPGAMYACGHDAHAAMLLGAAKILSAMRDEIPGEIRFFFQEAEETGHHSSGLNFCCGPARDNYQKR